MYAFFLSIFCSEKWRSNHGRKYLFWISEDRILDHPSAIAPAHLYCSGQPAIGTTDPVAKLQVSVTIITRWTNFRGFVYYWIIAPSLIYLAQYWSRVAVLLSVDSLPSNEASVSPSMCEMTSFSHISLTKMNFDFWL
jgi:hypothetical protein